MSRETELLEEIQKLTRRLAELETERSTDAGETSLTNPSVTFLQTNNATKAKPDNYSDGPWHEWISHFKLCAEINGWNEAQRCQQLAVSLRGRAQRIFLSLNEAEKGTFEALEEALRSRIQPDQQRKIHRITFASRKRLRGENLVDLATSLRQLASLAYGGRDPVFIEEELVDQFVKALDTRDLRVGVSQGDPKTLDDAVKMALKLESIHLTEAQHHEAKVNMAGDNNETYTKSRRDVEETAEAYMAGASGRKDDVIPNWAQKYFTQQEALLEEMKKCVVGNSNTNERKKSNRCYNCGKPGHIAKNCYQPPRFRDDVQGNANRAGAYYRR